MNAWQPNYGLPEIKTRLDYLWYNYKLWFSGKRIDADRFLEYNEVQTQKNAADMDGALVFRELTLFSVIVHCLAAVQFLEEL